MSDLFWLTDAQLARLEPFFPKSHGKPRVDDRRVLSGIIFINRSGLRWRGAPSVYGPYKALNNRWKRWNDKGIFAQMMADLAAEHGEEKIAMIDATYLKAHRTATSSGVRRGRGRLIGHTKGGMNTKLRAICDSRGHPLNLIIIAGQVGDYIGARVLLSGLPDVSWLFGDRGHDADWFWEALRGKEIRACIPGLQQRKKPVKYDKRRYKRRNRIESMFGRLKHWQRVAIRYNRCPKVFLSAIALVAFVIYWL
ncbi:IS5 family transposase [Shimia sp. R9_2]|uniref:IS5 family transposase n=1 Tax=Shimia sp. R9_2 TaxID=2821112 RepID=UPI001ADAABAE|nr:IS5 family transposase [Shimia sp. R9_2]MBO9399051.1 IS5 family transposase [Shimia sp. R9_2]